jgi:dihydrofolate synthase/folylpolyglutamate synthase
LGLLAFRQAGVDIAIIETGMGGRLDATNVIAPVLCCITPVAFDHQEHLGATLAAIAAEKAGIIKSGVPVVAAPQEPEVADVIVARAADQGAELCLGGRDYAWGGDHEKMWFRADGAELVGLTCALQGDHQLGNFAQAIAAAVQLRRQGLILPDAAIGRAGSAARWPGRLEWFGDPPCVLLDGAHNRLGAVSLAAYLQRRIRRPVRLIAALSGQRNPDEVLAPLLAEVKALYLTPVPEVVTVPLSVLATWGETHGMPAQIFATPAAALAKALTERENDEIVVVAGSLYLVAAIRTLLINDSSLPSPLAKPDLHLPV